MRACKFLSDMISNTKLDSNARFILPGSCLHHPRGNKYIYLVDVTMALHNMRTSITWLALPACDFGLTREDKVGAQLRTLGKPAKRSR